MSPAGNFLKKAHERPLESMSEAVLWDFHTNFFPRTQPWPREPSKHSHLQRSKVSTYPQTSSIPFLVSPAGFFSKKAHERPLESTPEAVLPDFHTNFFARIQPRPREHPKSGHLWKSKVPIFCVFFSSPFFVFCGGEGASYHQHMFVGKEVHRPAPELS